MDQMLDIPWRLASSISCCGMDIRRRQRGLRYGGRYILYPHHRLVVPWQPQSRISAQLMAMIEESLQVAKRIHSRLGGRLDHAHQEAAHGRPMAGLKEVSVLAEQNRQLQDALDGIVVQRRAQVPTKPH